MKGEEEAILERLEELTAAGTARWSELSRDVVQCHVGDERVTFEHLFPWVDEGVVSGADVLRVTFGDTGGVTCVWFSGSELHARASRLIGSGIASRGAWQEACRERLRVFAGRLQRASKKTRKPRSSRRSSGA